MKSKILLVEDDEKIVKALTIRLKSQGFDVVSAFDAVMAISKAMEHHPDVILLDISMPGGNGFTVAERLNDSLFGPYYAARPLATRGFARGVTLLQTTD